MLRALLVHHQGVHSCTKQSLDLVIISSSGTVASSSMYDWRRGTCAQIEESRRLGCVYEEPSHCGTQSISFHRYTSREPSHSLCPKASGSGRYTSRELSHSLCPKASGSGRYTSREPSHSLSPKASGSGRYTSREPSHPLSPNASGSGRYTSREPSHSLSPKDSGSDRYTSREPSHSVGRKASGLSRCTCTSREPTVNLWVSELVCTEALKSSTLNRHVIKKYGTVEIRIPYLLNSVLDAAARSYRYQLCRRLLEPQPQCGCVGEVRNRDPWIDPGSLFRLALGWAIVIWYEIFPIAMCAEWRLRWLQ